MVQLDLFSGQDGEEEPRTLTVGELTTQIKGLLEGSFSQCLGRGGDIELLPAQLGALLLDVKDEEAQLAGVI